MTTEQEDRMRTREQRVAEGRELAEARTANHWRLGDLAVEEIGDAETQVRDEEGRFEESKLSQFAADIGVEPEELRQDYRVSRAWPGVERYTTVSWSAHRLLVTLEDRFDVMQELAEKHGRVTCEVARAFVRARQAPKLDEAALTLKRSREERDIARRAVDQMMATLRSERQRREREASPEEQARRRQQWVDDHAFAVVRRAEALVRSLDLLNEIEDNADESWLNEIKRLISDITTKFRLYETRFRKGGKKSDEHR